jgi:YggT family protein
MILIGLLELIIASIIKVVIGLVVLLMVIRFVINVADLNPFGWAALNIRRLTDPMVNPTRRALIGFGADPKFAPLVVILLVVLVGFFAISLVDAVLGTIAGVIAAFQLGSVSFLIGYILYGLLAIYSLLIFIRIIFSWGMVSYANPVMKFLVRATDPLLVPLRRMIPPLGVFDISAIVAFILLMLFQSAIAGTLLRGQPVGFF